MIESSRILSIARTLTVSNGTYIEAGANDGIRQSNSLLLEKELGWSGILIEPSPAAFAALERNRHGNFLVKAALVAHDTGSSVAGAFRDGQLTGTLDPSLFARSTDIPRTKWDSVMLRARRLVRQPPKVSLVEVETTTLDAVIAEAEMTQIDILSLDVGGFELQALRGIDLGRTRPRVIILEVRPRDIWALLQLLTLADYALVENLSRFGAQEGSSWTGDHEDFLIVDKAELACNSQLRELLFAEGSDEEAP